MPLLLHVFRSLSTSYPLLLSGWAERKGAFETVLYCRSVLFWVYWGVLGCLGVSRVWFWHSTWPERKSAFETVCIAEVYCFGFTGVFWGVWGCPGYGSGTVPG